MINSTSLKFKIPWIILDWLQSHPLPGPAPISRILAGPPCCKCSALSSVSVEKWLSLISLTLEWYSTIFFDQKLAKNLEFFCYKIRHRQTLNETTVSPFIQTFSKFSEQYVAYKEYHKWFNAFCEAVTIFSIFWCHFPLNGGLCLSIDCVNKV